MKENRRIRRFRCIFDKLFFGYPEQIIIVPNYNHLWEVVISYRMAKRLAAIGVYKGTDDRCMGYSVKIQLIWYCKCRVGLSPILFYLL